MRTAVMCRALRCQLVVALAALGLPAVFRTADSQAPPQGLQGEWAMERQVRDRWMHGRQLPRFSPFRNNRDWLVVDSIRADGAQRRIHLTLRRLGTRRDSALIVADARGRIVQLNAGLAPYEDFGSRMPGDSVRWVELQRLGIDGYLSLAETRAWDFVPTIAPGRAATGSRWTDTIALRATDGPFQQSLDGTRLSRITGDTVVDGRRLWIVHDSARVRYRERYLERERTLDSTAGITRTASGVVRGRHLYDPDLRLFRERYDTTVLTGEAVLEYPDGRAFRTPARYERTRQWTLYDAPRYAARTAELSAASRRQRGGMVITPSTDLQRRLAQGDVAVRDSLIAVWRDTSDPDEAARVFSTLGMWSGRGGRGRASIDSLRVADGDTAHMYQLLARRAYPSRPPMDTGDVRAMLPFMEDPGIAWSLNASRDLLYENVAQSLTTSPPAIATDSTDVPCTPAACRLLAEQWRTAGEPRLRDVGLVALVATDPARWADSVLAVGDGRRPVLSDAVTLVRGVGASWPAALKAAMPSPGSDWRTWLEWMDGRDSAYVAAQAASAARTGRSPAPAAPRARFDESHETAIRFFAARTGRDIIAELQRAYAEAATDSARLVFGTMLQRMGELQLTNAEIAEALASGDPARSTLAMTTLLAEFRRMARPVPADSAAAFVDRLIAATVDSGPLWRSIEPGRTPRPGDAGPILHARAGRAFVNGDNLPSAVRATWGSRLEIISAQQWNERNAREASLFYTFSPVARWGRFIRVDVSVSERLARPDDAVPAQYAAWNSYYLMELNGEWVIVARQAAVT